MKRINLLVVALFTSINYLSQNRIINTSLGEVKLIVENSVLKVTNIPYAKAKRYELPSPVEESPPLSDPQKLSPACPQEKRPLFLDIFGIELLDMLDQSEDCLNLSVTRPNNNLDTLPVMIWIHGGSYISGAGDAAIFDPAVLVHNQNVIVVNISYRLGLLGFLGGYNDIPPNLGYLDILEAIKWVNKNISYFGGNPDNVTLFGQSAGGEAIVQMMLIEESKGLFKNVIIQSAPLGLIFDRKNMIQDMIEVAKEIPRQAHIDTILSRQKEVLAAASEYGLKAAMPFGVQYGKYPFPDEEDVEKIWKERTKEINILIGYTKDETSLYVPYIPKFKKMANTPIVGRLLKKIAVDITTKKVYKKGAKKFAKKSTSDSNDVYIYEIIWGSKTNGFGATHTIDLPLLLGDSLIWKNAKLIEGLSAKEVIESQMKVCALWARFARTGTLEQKGEIDGILNYKKN
ncbi:MAG: para-nitrobenzyl esterase [Psychroserpens sp.]|jgi:para-nitrobenzyl esterase